MTPDDFKSWRKSMGLSRKETANLLGLKKSMVKFYQKGPRKKKSQAKSFIIPKSVELACYALSRGVSGFDGKTATNSFAGLGAAEEIKMVKQKTAKAKMTKPKIKPNEKMRLAKTLPPQK